MPSAIDVPLVRALLEHQFPEWAPLPITDVHTGDHRTFRLGQRLTVRLPRAACYAPQVAKEHEWLARLAPHLPLPIPHSIALGCPAHGYAWPWSIRAWIDGAPAAVPRIADLPAFARALAHFLLALQRCDAAGAPAAGSHSFHRRGSLAVYDAEARQGIAAAADVVDAAAATAVWEQARATAWDAPPVWVHGDLALSNLLVRDGRLAAVIDFGCCAIGDPACDLVIAWTAFDPPSRESFRTTLPLDPPTWQRARGWALWKALLVLGRHRQPGGDPQAAGEALRTIAAVLADRP